MSVITFPTINVGGRVTQEVIRRTPQPPSKSSLRKSAGGKQRQGKPSKSPFGGSAKGNGDAFIDTARYRNSNKHNLCLDMLQDGFHIAFCELFDLMAKQKEILAKEQGDSSEVKAVLLEDEPEKLEVLKENLIAIETANRRGRADHVYQSQLVLAEYFSSKNDEWLADYFYQHCLGTSLRVGGDGRRREAEANFNLGILIEKKLDFVGATHYTELSYGLSKGKEWEDNNGLKLHWKACEALQRMYTAMAEKLEETDPDQAIEYLKKAFDKAQEAGIEKQIREAGFRLGKAYEEHGDSDSAIKLFSNYFEICTAMRDNEGKAQACQALADAYHSQGDVDNAIEYLTMYLDISKRLENKGVEGSACSRLATLYNSLGQYTPATEYCHQAFQSAKEADNLDVLAEFRTECGVVSANEMFQKLAKCIITNERPAITRILSWRDSRTSLSPAENKKPVDTSTDGNDDTAPSTKEDSS